MTVRVFVGLGSNVDRETMILQAVAALREQFEDIELSPAYDSAAVGFDGSDFLNLVAGFDTDLEVGTVAASYVGVSDWIGKG